MKFGSILAPFGLPFGSLFIPMGAPPRPSRPPRESLDRFCFQSAPGHGFGPIFDHFCVFFGSSPFYFFTLWLLFFFLENPEPLCFCPGGSQPGENKGAWISPESKKYQKYGWVPGHVCTFLFTFPLIVFYLLFCCAQKYHH